MQAGSRHCACQGLRVRLRRYSILSVAVHAMHIGCDEISTGGLKLVEILMASCVSKVQSFSTPPRNPTNTVFSARYRRLRLGAHWSHTGMGTYAQPK